MRNEIRQKIKKTTHERERAQAIRDNLWQQEANKQQAAAKQKGQEALAREREQRRVAAELAEATRPRKLLVSGDVGGHFHKLFSTCEAQSAKVGAFDILLCVGAFLPHEGGMEYFASKRAPLHTYFVDSGASLLQVAPNGKTLCEHLTFLGGYGVQDICGLRVAFLSGLYDPTLYDLDDADFVGSAFTRGAVEGLRKLVSHDRKRGIDVFLSCNWPTGYENLAEESSLTGSGRWQQACAQPLAELCLDMEPRYHIFGTADTFHQWPPFQTQRGVCRCIGLGNVGSTARWLHALALAPKRDPSKEHASNAKSSPFKRTAKEEAPPAKRRAPSTVEVPRETVLVALLTGDTKTIQDLNEQLQSSVVECGAAGTVTMTVPQAKSQPDDKDVKEAEATHFLEEGTSVPAAKAVSEEDAERARAAVAWLTEPPGVGVVRYTFPTTGPLGLRLSKDVPPWILEVRDGSLAARKAPRVPLGGIVLAVNGYDLSMKCDEAAKALMVRPVVLDVEWPADQPKPNCTTA